MSKSIDHDAGCICKGNWRAIVSEYEHLIGRKFRSYDGKVATFFGLVHADDDFYYGMWGEDRTLRLITCAGGLDGYTEIVE